jgi:carboxyl-terminal processing protease
VRLSAAITAAILMAALALPAFAAADKTDDMRTQAKKCEKEGDWSKACSYYAYILSKDPTLTEVRQRFQTCLRHFHRSRRHHDPSYREQVLNQDIATALKVYGEVLAQLHSEFAEEDKANLDRLFHQGLEELRLALNDDAFRREYLPEVKKEAVESFLAKMKATWGKRVIHYQLDAQNQALQVALAANKALGLRPTVTVLEIACGACNALDEHTFYLTPRQYSEESSALHGEAVGVGVELMLVDNKLIVSQVFLNSPAAKAGLNIGDQVTRIGTESAAKLSVESAAEKLKGGLGSNVELEVLSAAGELNRFQLTRQPVPVRSVAAYRIQGDQTGIGYIQLATFHENSLQEVDEAIRQLEMQGLRSLIIDLRGNAGGLFDASVLVAERFLEEGAAIVSTRGRSREVKRSSHNVSPMLMPLVVLIDGGTASAAEVLAGALKENGRATLIGQTTFGKSTMQHVVELKTVQAGGMRITWARFYSPLSRTLGAGGIVPSILVEQTSKSMFDDQLNAALVFLAQRAQ